MNKTFYIYEVQGIKNGCTIELEKRNNENFNKYGIMPIIIETYNYPDTEEYWDIVGNREHELAEINGYPKGPHYKVAREKRQKGGRSTTVRKSISSRANALIAAIAGGTALGNRNKTDGTLEKCNEAGKLSLLIEHTCPYCGLTLKGLNYRRWHGENCKCKNKI